MFERTCRQYMESDESTSLNWIVANISRISHSLSSWEQADAHEFLMGLLSKMEKESTEPQKDPIGSDISQLFGGWICKFSECTECKKTDTLYERYSVMSVDVTNTTNTLDDCIKSMISPEQLCDHECSHCKNKVKMSIRNMFASYPPILTIHFKRFKENISQKTSLKIEFPETLNVRQYILPSYASPSKTDIPSVVVARSIDDSHFEYKLVGVVAHMGIAQFGHYVSYVTNSCGEWFMYSDDICRKVDFKEVAKEQAYLLFYQQVNTELLGVPCFLKDGPPSESRPCLDGCGMYGTKENSYYCSKCYKKHFEK